jgi:MoaA/NifB/PqqE/SkfB family radical SAM enzyme
VIARASHLRKLRQRARAWRNMATSATMARLRPGWVPPPHVGYLLTTFRCNMRCVSCGAWQAPIEDDLSTQEWFALLPQLHTLDIVKLLGGEPFARPDMVELMAETRRVVDPYIMQLTTNGTATEAIVEAVRRVGWPGLQLRVSVDGLEETHDRQRGVQGSWAKATRTLEALAPLRRELGFHMGVNFSITDHSIGEVEEMKRYAASFGADLIPGVNVSPFLDGSTSPSENPQHFVLLEDPRRALRALGDHDVGTKRQLPRMDHAVGRFITGDVFRKEIVQGSLRFRCRCLEDILYMLPDGRVIICGVDHSPIGSVREQRLDEIWNSPRARAGRERVAACPGCLQASIHILSRLYGGKLGPAGS